MKKSMSTFPTTILPPTSFPHSLPQLRHRRRLVALLRLLTALVRFLCIFFSFRSFKPMSYFLCFHNGSFIHSFIPSYFLSLHLLFRQPYLLKETSFSLVFHITLLSSVFTSVCAACVSPSPYKSFLKNPFTLGVVEYSRFRSPADGETLERRTVLSREPLIFFRRIVN